MFNHCRTVDQVTEALVARTQRCWADGEFQSNEMREQAATAAAARIRALL